MFQGSSSSHARRDHSVSDGIALADDLYASNEALSRSMISAQNKEIAQIRESILCSEHERIQHLSTYVRVDGTEEQVPKALPNKFRTAKDQFSAEVRRYPQI